jgi:hypothetical protein
LRGGGSSCGFAFCGVFFGVGSGDFVNGFLPILSKNGVICLCFSVKNGILIIVKM